MKWQPMPACAREPSGTLVDWCCAGSRRRSTAARLTASPSFDEQLGRREVAHEVAPVELREVRRASQSATISIRRDGRSSPSAETSGRAVASRLPTTHRPHRRAL